MLFTHGRRRLFPPQNRRRRIFDGQNPGIRKNIPVFQGFGLSHALNFGTHALLIYEPLPTPSPIYVVLF